MNLYDLPYYGVYLISFKEIFSRIIKDNFVRIKFNGIFVPVKVPYDVFKSL